MAPKKKPLTEKQRANMVNNLFKYLMTDRAYLASAHKEGIIGNEDPEKIVKLIKYWAENQYQIAHLVKWANTNKRAFKELTPADFKQVQDLIKVKSTMES